MHSHAALSSHTRAIMRRLFNLSSLQSNRLIFPLYISNSDNIEKPLVICVITQYILLTSFLTQYSIFMRRIDIFMIYSINLTYILTISLRSIFEGFLRIFKDKFENLITNSYKTRVCGARLVFARLLEIVFTGNRDKGSNPFLSAKPLKTPCFQGFLYRRDCVSVRQPYHGHS